MGFQCNICGYEFVKKGDYTRHMNRKTPCKSQLTIYQCELCDRTFNHKGNYMRHIRRLTPCVSHEMAYAYYTQKFQEMMQKLEKKNEKIKEKNEEIKELRTAIKPTTIIGTNTTNNNTTNNTNITINVTQINAFGNENTEYITDADYQNALDLGLHGLQHLVHKKYLDPKHPENWNVAITNLRGNTCKVVTKRGIESQLKDEVTDLMYRNTNFDLEEYEGNQDIERPDDHEIEQALYADSKKAGKKYTRLCHQTELKIYNQRSQRTQSLGIMT